MVENTGLYIALQYWTMADRVARIDRAYNTVRDQRGGQCWTARTTTDRTIAARFIDSQLSGILKRSIGASKAIATGSN